MDINKIANRIALDKTNEDSEKKKEKFTGSSKGTHILANLVGIKNPFKLDNLKVMQDILYKAAEAGNLNVVGETWKKFEPQGLSGVLILSESHISFHFSPESAFGWADVFSCSSVTDAKKAMDYLCDHLKPDMKRSKITIIDRTVTP